MSPAPGSYKLVKAGFVQLDALTGAVTRILAFQYNPETVTRRLEVIDPAAAPREIVNFSVPFDVRPDNHDPVAQQTGILPAISAMQLLLYPAGNSLLVWVSGSKRIAPVRITEMQVLEQAFDPNLNPNRAQVAITLHVLKDVDLANNPRGLALWNAYFSEMQQLAQLFANASLGTLGLSGI